MSYPDVAAQPRFPELEQEILAFWQGDQTFEASIERRAGAEEYVFYDGPPFANGLPHYGHLLTGFVKDAVPALSHDARRPCRPALRMGLPRSARRGGGRATARHLRPPGDHRLRHREVQRLLPVVRPQVHGGVGAGTWPPARWVDFENDYRTLDLPYMESVMWAFKRLWDLGLVYEGFRVLPYSWALETPLSNTETRMDDVYKQVQDPALTVGFELESGERLLAGRRRRRGRCRRTSRSPSTRRSTTPWSSWTVDG